MKLRLLVLALVCLLYSVSAHAAGEYRTVEVESLRIAFDSEWSVQTAPGYRPVRFDISNLGGDRIIEIFAQGNRWWSSGDGGTFEIRQSLHLKPGDRLRFTIPVPVYGDNDSSVFQIRERGRVIQAFNYAGFQSNKSLDETSSLIVADPANPYGAMAASWPRPVILSRSYGGPVGSGPSLDLVLDPDRVPSDWLGFTSVRAIFIGTKEWAQLAVVQREALLTWTACGGDLIFVDGDLNTLLPDAKSRPSGMSASAADQTRYYFGNIHFLKSTDISAMGFGNTLLALRATVDPIRTLPANQTPDWLRFTERGFRLAIPGVQGVPVRSYMAILVVFSVLIGPVNYILLWRKKKQVLLVLTAPLTSLAFILVLAGYAVLGEGLAIRGRAESFTLLDQATKRAATRATVTLYAAGMAPWNGLRFPRDMAIFPTGTDGRGSRDRQVMDLTELQQFSSGIARARAPSNFEEISFRPARERLNFNRTGGGIAVINAMGATVTQLFYRSGGEMYTLGGPLRAGEQTVMRTGGKVDSAALPIKFRGLAENQAEGTYLAYLDRSPFLETGVPNVEERASLHLVLGYAGGEP